MNIDYHAKTPKCEYMQGVLYGFEIVSMEFEKVYGQLAPRREEHHVNDFDGLDDFTPMETMSGPLRGVSSIS